MAEKTKANAKRPAHPSPYSTWIVMAMLLPVRAVAAALVWATGRVLVCCAVAGKSMIT